MHAFCCRVCRLTFDARPLLTYDNMPASAQGFPSAETLSQDAGARLDVIQCPGCGLVQLANPPVPYHREVIRASAFSAEMGEFRRRQFAEFVRAHGLAGKRVFEIGCGRGEYLSLMKAAGARACGIEHADASVQACRQAGLDVVRGYIEDGSTLPDAPFDAFFCLNFLEHMPDPGAVLRGVRANLALGAVGLVEVPNFDMILRQRLFSEFISDHLFYFTTDTLANTLRLCGYDVLGCEPVWHDYILSATVRARAPADLACFSAQRERLRRELHAFADSVGAGGIAVWGAGHQALAVLALAGLGGKIRYVVDSAPFKQGKFTPATHIPIVAPAALGRDPVAAVLVMAAAYSDEVAAIVRRDFGPRMTVALLRESGLERA
jgi:SAM-dependent methyltransferase